MPHRSITRLVLTLLVLAGALAPAAQAQYTVPPDNPLVGNPLARGEIYVTGMRNPYRWSFDRLTGDIWIGDVGGSNPDQEEVTHLSAGSISGANLGWNCFSGTVVKTGCTPANHHPPVYQYPSGPDVVIGGYVVRDPDLGALAGVYLFAKLNSGIYRLDGGTATSLGLSAAAVSGFGEDGVGHLYATSLNGPVYRLTQSGSTLALSSIGNFTQPVAVAAAPGDAERLFVVEQPGTVKLRTGGQTSDFLDLTSLVKSGGEQGLLAFAPAPDYATSGRVFAFYTDQGNDLQLDEFRRTAGGPDRSDVSTRRPVLTIQHDQAQNHNGGQLLFGPDGKLYLSTGDGGTQGDPEGDAQSQASLLGKILRIDVSGGPPDTAAPKLRVTVTAKQRVLHAKSVVASMTCNERCAISASARMRIRSHVYTLRPAVVVPRANRPGRLKLELTRDCARVLKRALKKKRKVSVKITLRAADSTGNSPKAVTRTVRVTG
jgi:glucose/arabinose dehydrogenase